MDQYVNSLEDLDTLDFCSFEAEMVRALKLVACY